MSERMEIERAINLFIEAINRNDSSRIPLTDDVLMSGPMMAEPAVGAAAVRTYLDETSPFVAHLDLKKVIIEDDSAAIMVKFTGINGVVIEQDPVGGPVQILILTGFQRPEKSAQPDNSQKQGRRDQIN